MTNTISNLPDVPKRPIGRLPDWVVYGLLSVICACIFGLASYSVGIKFGQDFPAHLRWAKQLAENGVVNLDHYTYQQMVVILRALIPFSAADLIHKGLSAWLANRSYKIAGLLVVMIFYALLAVILYQRFARAFSSKESKHPRGWAFFTSLGIMLLAPINLFTIAQHRLYLGYIGINVFHNPTIILLKPLAVLLFWGLIDRALKVSESPHTIWLIVLTVISTLTKPNFSLCLLPVITVWLTIRTLKKQPTQIRPVTIGFILPAILVLAYQYWYGFVESQGSHVIIAPLAEMRYYTPTGLEWMFLLSFLFPLVVLILQFRKAVHDQYLLLAWGVFLVGAASTYLLAEVGNRANNLNFEWGAQVGLFLLFIQSLLFLISNWKLKAVDGRPAVVTWQKMIIVGVLGLHVISGIIWYFAEVLQPHQWWL